MFSLSAWNETGYANNTIQYNILLPLALKHITPKAIASIGLGMVSAASMSSADSAVLSSATVFANNLYKNAIKPSVSPFFVMEII